MRKIGTSGQDRKLLMPESKISTSISSKTPDSGDLRLRPETPYLSDRKSKLILRVEKRNKKSDARSENFSIYLVPFKISTVLNSAGRFISQKSQYSYIQCTFSVHSVHIMHGSVCHIQRYIVCDISYIVICDM